MRFATSSTRSSSEAGVAARCRARPPGHRARGWRSRATSSPAAASRSLLPEEARERRARLVRRLLGEEVATGQALAADVVGPAPPRVQDLAALVGPAPVAPDGEHGTADLPPGLEIGLVELAVDERPGAIVLAGRVDHLGVLEAPDILPQRLV